MSPAFSYVMRLVLAWTLVVMPIWVVFVVGANGGTARMNVTSLAIAAVIIVMAAVAGMAHVSRVKLIAGRLDKELLSNRQRRQMDIPFDADIALDMVEAAIRELPRAQETTVSRESMTVTARIHKLATYNRLSLGSKGEYAATISATVEPGDCCGSTTILVRPGYPAWADWFLVDDGTVLEGAEAIRRSLVRRVADRRRTEQAEARQTAVERELVQARLGMLQAQVEPHFLYNTLANAQILTRSDPKRADEMLGQLITYLRTSLPRLDETSSTVAEEVERSRAYLEVLKIRMGQRLNVSVELDEATKLLPFPPMMVQTLVENAIKHGLEPKCGSGNIWIRTRKSGDNLELTVADDGCGLGGNTSGTGVGLKNVRDRLRLAFGDAASLAVTSNFPEGVAATISLPIREAQQQASAST
jgi:hypothetical protein